MAMSCTHGYIIDACGPPLLSFSSGLYCSSLLPLFLLRARCWKTHAVTSHSPTVWTEQCVLLQAHTSSVRLASITCVPFLSSMSAIAAFDSTHTRTRTRTQNQQPCFLHPFAHSPIIILQQNHTRTMPY